MFCSNCGTEGSGNFCSKCGARLQQPSAPESPPAVSDLPKDWSGEVRYETLLRIPDVRDMVARAAAGKQQHISAEDWLSAADKLMSLAGQSIPLGKVMDVALPIFQQIGIKAAKSRTETIADMPGSVIVRGLCFLASEGQAIKNVQQFEDGCLIEAEMPSDFRSWAGSLYVSLRKSGNNETVVEAATSIKGQMFDWGKSSQCLTRLFSALGTRPTLPA